MDKGGKDHFTVSFFILFVHLFGTIGQEDDELFSRAAKR